MNPWEWTDKIERAIENRARGEVRSFHIGWGAGGIACRPRRGELPPDPIFGTFTERQLERGLTSRQWDRLLRKLMEYLEGQKEK